MTSEILLPTENKIKRKYCSCNESKDETLNKQQRLMSTGIGAVNGHTHTLGNAENR